MNNRRKEQGVRLAMRLAEFVGQFAGVFGAVECLIGLAKKPKGPGGMA